MNWLISAGFLWYIWIAYTLSYNTDQFPDPKYALRIWLRRASLNAAYGGAIAAGLLFLTEIIPPSLWIFAGVFVAATVLAAVVQILVIKTFIIIRVLTAAQRIKKGRPRRNNFLAAIAWSYYLPESRRPTRGRTNSHVDTE
jgi:hypothetical protein